MPTVFDRYTYDLMALVVTNPSASPKPEDRELKPCLVIGSRGKMYYSPRMGGLFATYRYQRDLAEGKYVLSGDEERDPESDPRWIRSSEPPKHRAYTAIHKVGDGVVHSIPVLEGPYFAFYQFGNAVVNPDVIGSSSGLVAVVFGKEFATKLAELVGKPINGQAEQLEYHEQNPQGAFISHIDEGKVDEMGLTTFSLGQMFGLTEKQVAAKIEAIWRQFLGPDMPRSELEL